MNWWIRQAMGAEPVAAAPALRLSPDLKRTARLYRRVDHRDPLAVRREAARRIQVSRLSGRWLATDPAVHVHDTVVPGTQATARVYRPADGGTPTPGIVYLHGGAFISGDLDFEHPRCLIMCRETGCAVISVGYRLAPEFPFPAALDDCVHAFQWLCGEASAPVRVKRDRLAMVGASAGGTLVAAACLRLRDSGMPLPRLQMLLYPVLDDRLETPSMRAFTDTPVWDARNCVHMWDYYLGPAGQRGDVSPYAAPARAPDLSGLPMAYLLTAEYDPLRDEGAAYARRLTSAGVPTELHQFPGVFHGFDTLADTAVSRRALSETLDVLRSALWQASSHPL